MHSIWNLTNDPIEPPVWAHEYSGGVRLLLAAGGHR